MVVDDLTCQELVELVTAYIEGAMPPHEHTRFEAHLAICTGCTAHVKQMRQTIGLLGTLTEATMTPEARDDLLDVFRRWKQA